ncbi:hypothetical protein BKA69DRAFT_1035407 [Paraphysoderma sedebokerense]|nr:hypothetical protein BKA69DRAFT_1035407 [Paraphysoderma sedebokerense]
MIRSIPLSNRLIQRRISLSCRRINIYSTSALLKYFQSSSSRSLNIPCRQSFHTSSTTSSQQLRRIFDDSQFFQDFNSPSSPEPTGLFDHPRLSSPEALISHSKEIISTSYSLVDTILNTTTPSDFRRLVINFDKLSDNICFLTDTAEFIRNAHPDKAYVNAANQVYSDLSNLLNILNTNVGLYEKLNSAIQNESIYSQYSQQEKRNAQVLLHDFLKSGIHLAPKKRQTHVALSNKIAALSREFIENSFPQTSSLIFPISRLKGLPNNFLENLPISSSSVTVPMHPLFFHRILKHVEDEGVRREVWQCYNNGNRKGLRALEELLVTRSQLAGLVGYNSYAEMFLEDKMCRSPESVFTFLLSVAKYLHPAVSTAANRLRESKRNQQKSADVPNIYKWDMQYYKSSPADISRPSGRSNQTTVGTALAVLSDIFAALYNIKLEPVNTHIGESWHNTVRRLNVIHPSRGFLGSIYCDLLSRTEGKYCSAAHFTIRGRRRIDWDSPSYDFSRDSQPLYQHPIVVLVTNFSAGYDGKAKLSLSDISTLYHEFGHAIHSILSTTDFQNISGTRTALDFSELPSTFMENFIQHPAVLARFQHYDPEFSFSDSGPAIHQTSDSKLFDLYDQLQLSILDQLYHSPLIPSLPLSSDTVQYPNMPATSKIHHDLITAPNSLSLPPFQDLMHCMNLPSDVFSLVSWSGGNVQSQFQHLAGYAGGYYTYLWCHILGRKIFERYFSANKMEWENEKSISSGRNERSQDWDRIRNSWAAGGEVLQNELLVWGGGRDPWACVEGVLGGEVTEKFKEGEVGRDDVTLLYK